MVNLVSTRVVEIALKMKQEVIEFGDSYKTPQEEAASESTTKKKGRTVVITTEDMQKRRNDVKARTTLLLALPDEHQLRFSKYKTVKELWKAILKTFGGNEATKKTKKNQLKQQYGNFKAEGSETLEQTFNRLQAIVSHLLFMDIEIKQDDLNQKFLTSLAPEWLMYTIVWRNRDDLNTMSLDDVYNHLKVYEPEVQTKSELNSQNMAFISSANTSSGKGEVYSASVPTASTQVSTASVNVACASISHDTVCAYIAFESNGFQIKYEDITQIDEDDIKEIDIKWNMALLSMRADRFWKKTGKKITIQCTDVAGFDKSKVECFNCHKMGHFARECRAPRSQDRENHALVANDEALTEFALMAKSSSSSENEVEARLVEFKTQEIKFCEKIRGLEIDVEFKNNKIEYLMNELEQEVKELIRTRRVLDTVLFPPPAQVYSPLKKDMSWTRLPEFADDTITDYSRPLPSIESNTSDLQNSNSSVSEHRESSSSIMSKPMIKFVKAVDSPTVIKTNKVETVRKSSVKYAEMYRNTSKSPKVRGNQRNWNNLKSQQLGKYFLMKNKACFKCGHFDYLAYDCGVWVEKGKIWQKNNFAHKNVTPRVVLLKTGKTPIAEQQSPHYAHSSPSNPTATTEPIPTKTPTETPTLRQYSRRATRIAQSKAFSPVTDETASLFIDESQGEAFPTVSSLDAGQDRENINKTFVLPYESTPRVTSLDADEGKRIKLLEDKDKGSAEPSGDDAPIKGRSIEIRKEVGVERSIELGSNDTKEMVNVLSSMEAVNILTSGVVVVSVPPVAGVSTVGVSTVSGLFPTVSAIFTTASVVTPYSRRPRGISAKDKGKEKVVEFEEPKKKKLQEQIDAQVAKEIEEEIARENQRMNEQIARDAEIARIHAKEELKMMIDGLDRSKELIVKHLQEYEQSEAELTIREKIELINELVKYQDHHAKILKYQAQQSKPLSKKEQREFYMSLLKSHAGWKTKHFRGMKLKEIKEKFIPVWKQIEDFVPMSSKQEAKRVKRKGLRIDQGSSKRMKTSEDEFEEDLKGMMQLVHVEEKIIRLGGHTAVYQFFVDMLKQFDKEDLHQLWILVKETLSIRQAIKDKEKELWVELKRLFKPDFEDQLWTHDQKPHA
nr:hypothetical protein [Tanacetum cinerariifolium]